MASKLKDTQDYSENLHILVPEHFQSVSVRYSATSQLAGIPNNWTSWFHPWKEKKGKISSINQTFICKHEILQILPRTYQNKINIPVPKPVFHLFCYK